MSLLLDRPAARFEHSAVLIPVLALLAAPACTSTPTDGDQDGFSIGDGDCDDANPAIYPGGDEQCDGLDNNCNGEADEGVSVQAYPDRDADGFGDATSGTQPACDGATGVSSNNTDCDDGDPLSYPEATTSECGGDTDYNCDGSLGTSLSDGGTLAVSVPAVPVSLSVTLAGAAVNSSNTSATDFGTIRFEDIRTGKAFTAFSTWSAAKGAPVASGTFSLVPGTYNVRYAVGAAGSSWPINDDALLLENVTVTSAQTISLNVPAASIRFTATLNGQTLTTSNTDASDEGELILKGSDGIGRFSLFSVWDDSAMQLRASAQVRIIPGTYDVLYSVVDDGPSWPANVNSVLLRGQNLSSDQNLTVNVPVTSVTGTLTLNGQTASASNSSADDEGALWLEDAAGERFKVMTTWGDSADQPNGTETFQVVPGTYNVLYSIQDPGKNWPYNENVLVKSGLVATAQTSFSVDVKTLVLQVTPTLGGQALSSSNGSALDEGELSLQDQTTGERFKLFSTWRDGVDQPISSPVSVPLIAGTFDVFYGVQDDGPFWPANQKRLLRTGLSLTASQSLTIDVPIVTATVNVTLDGQSVSSANSSIEDEGLIELEEVSSGDRFKLFTTWNNTTNQSAVPFSGRVVPGVYNIYYSVSNDGPHWPANTNVLVMSSVDFSSARSVTVELPVAELTLTPSLETSDGTAAVSSSNTSVNDYGVFSLRDSVSGESFDVYSAFNVLTSSVLPSAKVQVLPGAYTVEYSSSVVGSSWSGGENYPVGCFTLE